MTIGGEKIIKKGGISKTNMNDSSGIITIELKKK